MIVDDQDGNRSGVRKAWQITSELQSVELAGDPLGALLEPAITAARTSIETVATTGVPFRSISE